MASPFRLRIDPDALYHIDKVSELLPHRPSRAAVWRWCQKGVTRNGTKIKLAFLNIGAKRFITGQALLDFMTPNETPTGYPRRSAATRRQSSEAALKRLKAAGY